MSGFTYKSYSFIDKDPIIDEVYCESARGGFGYLPMLNYR